MSSAVPPPSPATITVYGANWCPDCRRAKRFLGDHRISYEWIDLDQHPERTADVEQRNNGKRIIPTIVFPDGGHLAEPTNDELAERLGITRTAARTHYDVIIIGGGPTGLTAAIYAARENFSVLIIERSALGGQAAVTERLDNYPGFPEGVGGAELADRMAAQAARYGVETLQAVGVDAIVPNPQQFTSVHTSTGDRYSAGAVLIATGSTYRRLHADGEDDLIGAGIHFCATCDGPFYRDAAELVVIGGGNSGLEEGLFLTQFAQHVTVIEYADQLAGNRLLQDKVRAHPKMTVRTGTEVVRFEADDAGKLAAVWLRASHPTAREEPTRHPSAGAFVFVGLSPNSAFVQDIVELDPSGFIVTDRTFATSAPGVFAAGDVRQGSTKQLASAVGEGAAAAIQIRHHLDTD